MNDIFQKKTGNIWVREVVDLAKIIHANNYPTFSIEEFSLIVQKPVREIYKLITNKILPENLIVGGYNYRKSIGAKKPRFYNNAVWEWVDSSLEDFMKGIKTVKSDEIDFEINEFLNQ